jgi:hypothetical protein
MIEIEPLGKEEMAWLKKLQKVLNSCPSQRMAAYTTGDNILTLYDVAADDSEEANLLHTNNRDWCHVVYDTGCELGVLKFPFAVHATSG